MTAMPPDNIPVRQALARSIGLAAFVYGHPLVESMRTCAKQTGAVAAGDANPSCAPIDVPLHWAGPTQADDRDVVTPANDLMYTTAWINLAAGPRWLTVPAAALQPQRYFVLALYDAYTENFHNLGPRNCNAQGERVLLVGPDEPMPLPADTHVVRAPTNLVWLLARFLVADAADLPLAKQLQSAVAIAALAGSAPAQPPLAVQHWSGPAVDVVAATLANADANSTGSASAAQLTNAADTIAAQFFTNLCHALADAPGRTEDAGLLAWFGQVGVHAGTGFNWQALDTDTRAGLRQGFAEGVHLVVSATHHRQAKPWVLSWRNGRYGNNFLARAIVAYIGLGALQPSEALYASGHFDADGHLLDGQHAYTLRFAAGAMPPAAAFWSVTLYDADRFLYPNALRRHAIGDRTKGLQRDADGGLTLHIAHAEPAATAGTTNWLPAPAGRFYLILRLYHPGDDARSWLIPAVTRVTTATHTTEATP